MAYDSSAAYQPPRRAYYDQQRQPAPVQTSHAYHGRDPYARTEQLQYAEQDAHQYVQEHASYDNSRDLGTNGHDDGAQTYSDGYMGGYQRQKPRPISGERLRQQYIQQPQQYDGPLASTQDQYQRNYDPRFQQRPGRAGPPAQYQQAPDQRAQQAMPTRPQLPLPQYAPQYQDHQDHQPVYYQAPRQRPPPPNTRNDHAQAPWPHPHSGHSQAPLPDPREQHVQDQRHIQGSHGQPPQRQRPPEVQPPGSASEPQAQVLGPAPTQLSLPSAKSEPKKMTMEEWKAQEKAKMHKAAVAPDYLPQDNAFPTFPNKKKDKTRPDDHSGTTSQASGRSSDEHVAGTALRPSYSRENSYGADKQSTAASLTAQRPSLDHKPFSFEPVADRPGTAQDRPPQAAGGQRPPNDRHHPEPRSPPLTPANGQESVRIDHTARMQQVQNNRETPPQLQGPRQSPGPQGQPPYRQPAQMQQQNDRPPRPVRQMGTTRPAVAPIDVTQLRRPQPPGYMDHQPLSPAHVPPRPSTAQGARPPPFKMQSAQSAYSQLPFSQASIGYGEDGNPSTRPGGEHRLSRSDEIGDLYDEYTAEVPGQEHSPQSAAPRSAAEIEAEMPDFDSAAPSQTSMLHKRNQAVEQQVARNSGGQDTPSLPVQRTPPAPATVQDIRYGGQQQQPPPHNNGGPGPWRTDHSNLGRERYQAKQPYNSDGQYPPQGLPMRPPQPAYANEQSGRRSMDDVRQMPYRQTPPRDPRMMANGYGPRGPPPPQQRPELQRDYSGQTVQTVWSDPGQQRAPSAPPQRQGIHSPPGQSAYGAPLTQQRSAPEYQEQQRHNNPDALPHHPTPIRPGLTENRPQPAKPPPVRNYDSASSDASTVPHTRKASIQLPSQPVTRQELEQLGNQLSANPNDYKLALLLAKRLVEAASVLASEGGRADAKTTAKNRERYILDAHKRVKKLVAAGYPEAMFYLADCYGQGALGLEVDTKEAFNLYQAAAKQGHPQAAYRTAVCCEMGPEEGGGTRKDYAKAVQWYRRAATLGETPAMYKLGIVLLKGLLGQPRDVGEAVTWLKRAAERADGENPHALHELGTLYDSTNTDPQVRNKVIADDAYALALFKQAGNLGYKFSQFRLGQAYEYGTLGVDIDNRASIQWYSKAAAQGEHQAELALSGWYLTGAEGILQNSDTEAYLWARKAAQAEPPLAKAMFAMGYFNETGIGCPANIEEARKWYGRAASYKFPKALERLEELKKSGKTRPAPVNGKLMRKDQKRDEAECVMM